MLNQIIVIMKHLNKLLLAVVMAVTALAASAFDVDDCSFDIYNSTNRLVSCTGLSSQGKGKSSLSLEIPGTVSYNGTTYRVYRITANAFANQSNLTGVRIWWGTKIIADGAFNGCANITFLRMPSSVQYVGTNAFIGCTKLKSVYYSTYNTKPYTNLSSWINQGSGITLYLPKRTYLSNSDITGMSNWANFTINKDNEDVYDWYAQSGAYWCALSLGSNEEQSPTASVDLCLTGFNNSSYATWAPTQAYNYMNKADIKFVYKQIAGYAFYGKTNMTSIDLDKLTSLTYIGGAAFSNCSALTTLKIPSSVTEMSAGSCIDGCTALTAVTINSANTYYSAYNGAVFNKAQTTLYRVPEGKSGTFYDSAYPTGVTSFANYAFYNCKKVTHIWVPYGVKSIGSNAFYNCTGLTQLKIPSSVTSLASNALYAAKITWCNVNLTTAPTVTGVGSITHLFVPYGATSSYTTAKGWNPTDINTGGQQAFDYETGSVFYTVTSSASTTANNGSTYAGRAKVVCDGITYNRTSATTVNVPAYVTISGKNYAVTKIGEDAFNNNTGNITVTGCANVDTVGDYAFQNQPITSYAFTHNLNAIMNYAFDGSGLTGTVQLPYGVHYVRSYAFGHGKYERIVFPASIDGHNGTEVTGTTTLKEFIWNQNWGRTYTGWDFTGVPSNCYFRFPTGMIQQWKNNSKLSSRASYITAGAYDYAYYNNYTGTYFCTIISTASTTYNGTTYAGKAKYVYHPNIQNQTATTGNYGFATSEQDRTVSGDYRSYLITEIGDSLLYGSKYTGGTIPAAVTRIGQSAFRSCDYKVNNLTLPSGLTFIGHDAFYNSKITGELKVPASVTTLEDYALCTGTLTSIYFPDMALPTMGSCVWSQGISGNVWVPNSRANSYLTEANKWGTNYSGKLAVYIKPSRSTVTFGSVVPVDMQAAGINAYYASNYDKSQTGKEVTLTKANKAPENTGLLLTDLTDKEYRIPRPTTSVSAPMTNYLVAVSSQTNVYTVTGGVGYYWDNATSPYHFKKPTNNWYIGGPSYERTYGSAYLKLSSAEAGNLTDVYTNLWPYTPPVGVVGDVTGDGVVDIADVNAIIDIMLHKKQTSDFPGNANVDGQGGIDIGDVNAVINIMLHKS